MDSKNLATEATNTNPTKEYNTMSTSTKKLTKASAVAEAVSTMKAKILEAQMELKLANAIAEAKLVDKEGYLTYLAETANEIELVDNLNTVMAKLSGMASVVTNDGTKYDVNCYSINERVFGAVMGRVLGIIKSSSAMFTDERQREFTALTGMPYLAVSKVSVALGAPAYYSKGVVVPSIPVPDLDNLEKAMLSVCQAFQIPIAYASIVSEETLANWFKIEQVKADGKLESFTRDEVVNNGSKFTIED